MRCDLARNIAEQEIHKIARSWFAELLISLYIFATADMTTIPDPTQDPGLPGDDMEHGFELDSNIQHARNPPLLVPQPQPAWACMTVLLLPVDNNQMVIPDMYAHQYHADLPPMPMQAELQPMVAGQLAADMMMPMEAAEYGVPDVGRCAELGQVHLPHDLATSGM